MNYDIAIVGAGIAGASLAAAIGARARVLLLEAEDQPGYHATGRSAAFWSETYGGPAIQPLTTASGPALRDGGFLDPLGSLHIGRTGDAAALDAFLAEFADTPVALDRVDPATLVPGLRREWRHGVMEASCAYIDVAAYYADRLRAARCGGAVVETGAALAAAERQNERWRMVTHDGRVFFAEVLVNASGAWADAVASAASVRPIGVQAYRRTMVQLLTDTAPPSTLPHVADISGGFYFKPEAGGRLWLSPHDETPVNAHDVQPEEIDVATAIDRFEQVVDWRVAKVERSWAGLRSFAPDRAPVYGFDAHVPGFFWFAGQGGFGIQTAPAAAQIGAALLVGGEMPTGVDVDRYAATRFARP
ncbi:NAD(P)/FAD-dependent oxidoreductase [Sphingomonas sp. Mn802worker]|uniref:NAD(P)/FAD-dependent oxidoreductase n=1 Tax=Sphingomonas sp. Mn802worker TaxID=629773 RepID=UPI00037A4A91|nr:FAD-binding oxidoreductase [Sphingomonas sp. Mn802worker]